MSAGSLSNDLLSAVPESGVLSGVVSPVMSESSVLSLTSRLKNQPSAKACTPVMVQDEPDPKKAAEQGWVKRTRPGKGRMFQTEKRTHVSVNQDKFNRSQEEGHTVPEGVLHFIHRLRGTSHVLQQDMIVAASKRSTFHFFLIDILQRATAQDAGVPPGSRAADTSASTLTE